MNFDLEKTVWQRIGDTRSVQNAEQTLLSEQLEELILDEKQDAQTYRQLAARTGGADATQLRRIGAQEENHARSLTALHYVITGRRTDLQPALAVPPAKLCAALRERYLAEVSGAQRYRQAGASFPEHAALFERLAADETHHAQIVSQLLERQL